MRHRTHSNTTLTRVLLARAFSIGFHSLRLERASSSPPYRERTRTHRIKLDSKRTCFARASLFCFASTTNAPCRRAADVEIPTRTRARGFGQHTPPRIRQSRISLSSHPRRRTSRAKNHARRRRKLFFSTIPTRVMMRRVIARHRAPRRVIRVMRAIAQALRASSRASGTTVRAIAQGERDASHRIASHRVPLRNPDIVAGAATAWVKDRAAKDIVVGGKPRTSWCVDGATTTTTTTDDDDVDRGRAACAE